MNTQAILAAAEITDLGAVERCVLFRLCIYANGDSQAWPSVPTLATALNLGQRTIRRLLRSLEEKGLIGSERRFGEDGGCRSSTYRLTIPGVNIAPPLSIQPAPPIQIDRGDPIQSDRAPLSSEPGAPYPVNQGPTIQSTPHKYSYKESEEETTLSLDSPSTLAPSEETLDSHPSSVPRKTAARDPQRGTRLVLTDLPGDWKDWALKEQPGINPEKTFERFHDFWIAIPGARGKKLDWFATWRNWVRDEDTRKVHEKGEKDAAWNRLTGEQQDWYGILLKKYPGQKDETCSMVAWARLNPDKELCRAIGLGLKAWKLRWDHQGTAAQYIPKLSSWLQRRLWEERIAEQQEVAA